MRLTYRERLDSFSPVSIHASVKDATDRGSERKVPHSFNPRICKRCDTGTIRANASTLGVSIHASVKDATDIVVNPITQTVVSIHASVKDATDIVVNPITQTVVSIHASVKDATCI